jgi:hypothetical protein
MRRLSSFAFWILLGLAVVIVPIACGSSSSNNDSGPTDAKPDTATHV